MHRKPNRALSVLSYHGLRSPGNGRRQVQPVALLLQAATMCERRVRLRGGQTLSNLQRAQRGGEADAEHGWTESRKERGEERERARTFERPARLAPTIQHEYLKTERIMNLQSAEVPDYSQRKKHRLEGTQRMVRGRLGECPRGWHITRMDCTLFYRTDGRPLAFGDNGGWRKVVRLDRAGFYRTPRDGRYAIVHCAHLEKQHPADAPWASVVPWLRRLTPECEITATIWAERGERVELDRMLDYFRPLPHEYPEWERHVKETHWIFKAYRRSKAEPFSLGELPPPTLPPVLVLR